MVQYLRILTVGAVLMLSACSGEPDTGPEEVHWDRDVCELCIMLLSDARFVAQVRGGPKNKVYKFDDVGCATNWLNDQPWAADPATEVWVAEHSSTRDAMVWLKARDARYAKGDLSPMDYGFLAYKAADLPTGFDFVEMTTHILAGSPNHICSIPE